MEKTSIKTRVLGVDISFEATTFAIVDIRGEIIAMSQFPTLEFPDVSNYVTKLTEEIITLVEANGGYESIRSIGISAPSANYKTGCIENAANLPWDGVVPLAALLRDRLGIAVALANDAHVIALGEQAFGSAHGMQNFIVMTLGHGIGSCFFSNGVAHLGNDGFAGEVGHTCVVPNGRECGCGNKGCLETYCAAKGIVITAQKLLKEDERPSKMREQEKLSPRIIAELCDEGDELAIETFRRVGTLLGIGIANYASVINPEAVIFTGGIARAGKWLFEPAEKAFNEHVFHNIRGKVKFLVSTINAHEREVLGASVLAWDVEEYSLFK